MISKKTAITIAKKKKKRHTVSTFFSEEQKIDLILAN